MHAAGVVISQKSIDEYVPLSLGSDNSPVTQFTMTTLEELGLLKMDFLGLRTLTVIQNAARLARQSTGKKIDMSRIDYDDKAVFDSLCSGKTDGVFQLETQDEELYEGIKAAESGGCDRGDFSVPSGTDGFYPAVCQRKESSGTDHL